MGEVSRAELKDGKGRTGMVEKENHVPAMFQPGADGDED